MSVFAFTKSYKIFCVLPHNVLHFVLTFKGGFKDLTLKQKSMIPLADIDMDLSRMSLEIHKYNFDLDTVLPPVLKFVSSPKSTPSPGTQVYATFVNVANKTKIICKKVVNEEEKTIFKDRVKKTVELLWSAKFLP